MQIILAFAFLCAAFLTSAQSAEVITSGDTKVSVIFYVKDGDNSPYQGLLQFTPQEYSALTPDTLQAQELAQFAAWKANLIALQAAAAANPPVEGEPQ